MTRPATPPQAWDIAFAAWKAAKTEEDAYDRDIWLPSSRDGTTTKAINDEIERLMAVREAAEVPLFSLPALNAHQLAMKCLMAFDNGRECTGWLSAILSDCCRFADDSLTRGHLSDDRVVGQHNPAGHRDWLAERNSIFERVNRNNGESTDHDDHSLGCLEAMVADLPARTADDVIAKLVLIAQLVAEGFDPSIDLASSAIVEARRHLGLGSAASLPAAWRHQA